MIANSDRMIYHMYPLSYGTDRARSFSPAGLEHQPGQSGPVKEPAVWAEHIRACGCNTLLLGPLWLSESHGYDTTDYRTVDPRVGHLDQLRQAIRHFHDRGIDVVLDGVFNHSGRSFFAFRDLEERGPASDCRDWYKGLDFGRPGPGGERFCWSGWHGHRNLPEFRLENLADGSPAPAAAWLLETVRFWIRELGIDGLRLDAADCLHPDFLRRLTTLCHQEKPGFWVMGEVIHGDYGRYVREWGLDSVTNYEAWKGLWSSHNDRNYHEIAWTLQREFGPGGTCRDWWPASFTDNHDTSRVASLLQDSRHLYPLWGLAMTMPGLPTVYCGSETGWTGMKEPACDWNLRPALAPGQICGQGPHPRLREDIARLARFRQDHPALRCGGFTFLGNSGDHLAFARSGGGETLVVVVNARQKADQVGVDLKALGLGSHHGRTPVADCLNQGTSAILEGACLKLTLLPGWVQVFNLHHTGNQPTI